MSKYLTEKEIEVLYGELALDLSFLPMSQDSYNESAIIKAIMETGRQHELCYAAINMSCIGYGSKKYGNFKLRNIIIDIAVLLNECRVKLGLTKEAKLTESDLTPQRLCRAFRYQIQAYILANKFETYLYRKYSDHNPKLMHVCFRGAEYLDGLSKEELDCIHAIHVTIDAKLGTTLADRIERVFQAKGYVQKKAV